MNTRNIEKVLTPKHFNWVGDGFYTTSFIGTEIPRSRMSPFFAVGYNAEIEFEASNIPRGVGAHPHKGFETVTIAYKGKIEHKDSRGNHGVIGEGDVQWMTAGSGILHQEYHEQEFSKKGGAFQMVQMWVNLPAKYKETQPKYQDLAFDTMPRVGLGNNSFVQVIAGSYRGQNGAASTFSPIALYNAHLTKGTEAHFSFDTSWNTALLVVEGVVVVNGDQELKKDSFALMENNTNETFSVASLSPKSIVLVMSGAPLNEPIAHYGPFVMNTQEQLVKAFEEFEAGKFGNL